MIVFLLIFFLLAGSAAADERVIGGKPSALHPSRVAIVGAWDNSYDSYSCGGTLVRPRWVMTAAHCVDNNPIDVVLGRRNLKTRSGERIAVVAKRVHPNFNLSSLQNDLALLRLSRAPKRFKTISLGEAPASSSGEVAGWGYTLFTRPAIIHSARQTVLATADCRWNYGSFFDESSMFCARGEKQSICQGDSGNGFFVGGKVVGVVSWSPAGCQNYPDGYARIDSAWANNVLSQRGPWRVRKVADPPYLVMAPMVNYFFSLEEKAGEHLLKISFYPNYSLLRASVRLEGSTCLPPDCSGKTLDLLPAIGRREWLGEFTFRGCVRLRFRGLVAEGKNKGDWVRTSERICA